MRYFSYQPDRGRERRKKRKKSRREKEELVINDNKNGFFYDFITHYSENSNWQTLI